MSSKEVGARSAAMAAQDQERGYNSLPTYSAQQPTTESPFNFPSQPPPAFDSASSSANAPDPRPRPGQSQFRQPIAIPQINSYKTAPFLDSYARPLLQYGITSQSWGAFLNTMSAFLAAKVSEKALAHAIDIGRHVGNVPKRFGQGSVDHAKHVGNTIGDRAYRGNYVGAAVEVVGGAVSLSVGTALRAVGAVVSLPGHAINAVVQKPKTPRERATAYAAAANEQWLEMRGLQVQLVDTVELARILGVPVNRLLDLASASDDRSAAGQMFALRQYLGEVETVPESTLELGPETLWLAIL